MSAEMNLLKKLVFSQSFRNALSEMASSERKDFIEHGWGSAVGFLDIDEVTKYARLTLKTLTAGPDRGINSLANSYRQTLTYLEEKGLKRDDVFLLFFESVSFSGFREIEGTGTGICLEEAFYRFIATELNSVLSTEQHYMTLNHESLHCIARGLTTSEISAASVTHPLMRSTGCGIGGFTEAPRYVSGKVKKDDEQVCTFYFGGKSFIHGEVSSPAIKILKMAMHLNEQDSIVRRTTLSKCFPSNPILGRLIRLEVI